MNIYLKQIAGIPQLTEEEENSLPQRLRAGDTAARARMIESLLPLVVFIARRHAASAVALEDLVAEGNRGLMNAVDHFQPGRGGRLSAYAGTCVTRAILRALENHSRVVRLPGNILEKLARLNRVTGMLADELGREPADAELAEVAGLSRRSLAALRAQGRRAVSLDAPACEDGGTTYGDTLRDPRAVSPADAAAAKARHADLYEELAKLDPRERAILKARFGLEDGEDMTLEKLSVIFKVSRERVRQVEARAMRKLYAALVAKDAIPPPEPHRAAA